MRHMPGIKCEKRGRSPQTEDQSGERVAQLMPEPESPPLAQRKQGAR